MLIYLSALQTNLPFVCMYRIGGVLVNVLASSVVDRLFEPGSGQTRDNKIGMCCFSAKHAVLRSKSRDWLVRNQNNVSEWAISYVYLRKVVSVSYHYANPAKRVGLVQSGPHHHLIEN